MILSYIDMIMSTTCPNRLRAHRLAAGWSQAELAARAGISRAGVSAIEAGRLVPSVAAALALAKACDCRVEDLFLAEPPADDAPVWISPPSDKPFRYWLARVGSRTVGYPAATSTGASDWHDGLFQRGRFTAQSDARPGDTLVLASCDPAAGLLAAEYRRTTPFRLIVLSRSSRAALELLARGLVHLAGIHLARSGQGDGNAAAVRRSLGAGYRLVHVARWQEGLAVAMGEKSSSPTSLVRSRRRWIGREEGSGARECLDELFAGRRTPRRVAHDHRGVVEAVSNGWADVGVCVQLPCEEAGLRFLPVREERYDLCFAAAAAEEPRIAALLDVLRSPRYRRLLGELPGYNSRDTGEVRDATAATR
jgi:molybdate-binding protein/DNA-binding XRE family transcriptional regulator